MNEQVRAQRMNAGKYELTVRPWHGGWVSFYREEPNGPVLSGSVEPKDLDSAKAAIASLVQKLDPCVLLAFWREINLP